MCVRFLYGRGWAAIRSVCYKLIWIICIPHTNTRIHTQAPVDLTDRMAEEKEKIARSPNSFVRKVWSSACIFTVFGSRVYLHILNSRPVCIANSFRLFHTPNITNYSNGFFIRHIFFSFVFVSFSYISFACICSTFSAASSISTACHFLIPCELIVCHFPLCSRTLSLSLSVSLARSCTMFAVNRHSLRFNSMTNGMRCCANVVKLDETIPQLQQTNTQRHKRKKCITLILLSKRIF